MADMQAHNLTTWQRSSELAGIEEIPVQVSNLNFIIIQ